MSSGCLRLATAVLEDTLRFVRRATPRRLHNDGRVRSGRARRVIVGVCLAGIESCPDAENLQNHREALTASAADVRNEPPKARPNVTR